MVFLVQSLLGPVERYDHMNTVEVSSLRPTPEERE